MKMEKPSVNEDLIALIDLDSSIADYTEGLRKEIEKLRYPSEPEFQDRAGTEEPPYIRARRKLIQSIPSFWRDLEPLKLGFDIVDIFREFNFELHVLTKGPQSIPEAWSGKVEWCKKHIPDVLITITGDKSLVYGKVLLDDFPPYFTEWLKKRPRGLVICVAQPWNESYEVGGPDEHPNVIRYDGTNLDLVRNLIQKVVNRKPLEHISEPKLQIIDERVGDGDPVLPWNRVEISYTATVHHRIFDRSSTPVTVNLLSPSIIQGWKDGIVGMKKGGIRTLIVPPSLAYGEKGLLPSIPPDSVLTFEIELVAIR